MTQKETKRNNKTQGNELNGEGIRLVGECRFSCGRNNLLELFKIFSMVMG